MRATILTHYYRPEVGAPQARLSTLARLLAERGVDVTVHTGFPHYPDGRVKPPYRNRPWAEEREGPVRALGRLATNFPNPPSATGRPLGSGPCPHGSGSEGGRPIRLLLVVGGFAAVIWASHRHGAPDRLPQVALDWTLLFHVERAAALLGAIAIVLLVGWRAVHGHFPLKFGQVEYAAEEAAAQAEAITAAQEQRLRILEVLAGIRDPGELDERRQG